MSVAGVLSLSSSSSPMTENTHENDEHDTMRAAARAAVDSSSSPLDERLWIFGQAYTSQGSMNATTWTACLLAHAPPSFLRDLESMFRQWMAQDAMNSSLLKQCILQHDNINNNNDLFNTWTQQSWWTRPWQQAVAHSVRQTIQDRIQGDYETPDLLQAVLEECRHHHQNNKNNNNNQDDLIRHIFGQVRLPELFAMVADYPDSTPALYDLRHLCDALPYFATQLSQSLRQTLIRRLCHPGAETTQIMQVYIHTIHTVRILGIASQAVTAPVRHYLRHQRTDTVRCIITSLTHGDLYAELRKPAPLTRRHDEAPTLDWQPKPSIFQPVAGHDHPDILTLLVSIYGSKEVFVNEYRVMLADKLLLADDYNTDQAVHTAELLKLRFGEQSMRHCEVMIKDLEDSKRTNAQIQELQQQQQDPPSTDQPQVDAVLLSHVFWPKLQKERLSHHPRLQAPLDEYNQRFGQLKNPRTLVWFPQLGTVTLELDVLQEDDILCTKEFQCTPLQATLLLHFEDKDTWTLTDLSNETAVPETLLKKRLAFWLSQRVVWQPTPDTYQLVCVAAATAEQQQSAPTEDDDEDDAATTTLVSYQDTHQEEMQVYESYIVGMLTNMGSLPLSRIHSMLQMFANKNDTTSGGYHQTPAQLSRFLQSLCAQHRLECGPDGLYKLCEK